jgi:hypothetical protein
LGAYLGLLVGGEYVYHSVNSLDTRISVKRGESEMTCFRNDEGRFNGFQVPHFTNQDHIRILSKDVF